MLVRKCFWVVVLTFLVLLILIIVKDSPKCALVVHSPPVRVHIEDVPAEPPQIRVLIRLVHFDDRPQYGYKNVSVFLLEASKSISEQNLIVACGVGSIVSFKFQIWPCGAFSLHNWICESFPNLLIQDQLMLHCYDLPVDNGSTAFVIYKLSPSSSLRLVAQSAHRLVIPESQVEIKIVTCSRIFSGRPPRLVEWLHYQKAIGVDHIHIITDARADALHGAHFKQAMKTGFVSVKVWQQWQNDQIHEVLAYEDCIYRFRGEYDYAFVIDTDDYFVPMNPSEKKLRYYVDRWCKDCGSCAFSWIDYYPACGLKDKPGTDGNVTAVLKSSVSVEQKSHKFLHRLADIDVHVPLSESESESFLVNHHRGTVKIPSDKAYVAHHRMEKLPADIACKK